MAYRDGPFQDLRVPLTWAGAAAAVVAIIVALALLFTDHREDSAPGAYGSARAEFDQVIAPVTGVVAAPIRWTGSGVDYVRSYFFAISENRKLKAQIAELERWRDAALALKNINTRYEVLLKLRTEPPIPMATARVVSDVRGPFSNARLADAGSDSGIKVGNPVISEKGVVGRVVGAARTASRILLLTDVDSRTPVLVDRTNARAILTGDGGPSPRLEYLRGRDPVKEGDRILTSGDGGLYPRGLPVGVAAKDARGVWRVRLYTDEANIDYVRILEFDDFSQKVDQTALSAAPLPPITAQEKAEIEAALTGKPAVPAPPAATPAGGAAKPAPAATTGAATPATAAPARPTTAAATPAAGARPAAAPAASAKPASATAAKPATTPTTAAARTPAAGTTSATGATPAPRRPAAPRRPPAEDTGDTPPAAPATSPAPPSQGLF